MPAAINAPYLRATVSGRERYADLVLPTDEPVSMLVPQLLRLLDEAPDLGQVHLATSLGQVLDPSVPLSQTDLVDGVRLHLVTAHDLPPAPLVHELVGVVEHSEAPGRWTERNRQTTLAVLGALIVAASIVTAFRVLPSFDAGPALTVAGALLLLSMLATALRAASLAWVTAALGIGTATTVLARSDLSTPEVALSGVGLAVLALAAGAWCGGQLVAGATSVATLALLSAVGELTWLLTDDVTRTAAVVGTLTVLVVGLAPRLALGASGVFTLDGRLADGDEVAAVNAEDAVARAHWSLTGGTLVAAAVFAVSAFALGQHSDVDPWPTGLTVVLSLALALRARHFPLALHRGGLWAGSVAGPLGLAVAGQQRWAETGPGLLAALALVGVVVALTGVLRRTPLQQARARRRANQLETTAILLSLPTLLGVFAVYQDLLSTFQ